METYKTRERIETLIEKHHIFRNDSLNMIASENITSPSLRKIVASDFMHRYGEYENHNIKKRWDEGNYYIIEVEKIVQNLAKKLFRAKYVDLRPISGQIAILSSIGAFTTPGTTVFETAIHNGGHGWCEFPQRLPIINYRPEFLPFDTKEWNIDIDKAIKKILKIKPSVILLGASFYLFPHPISELRSAADDVGALIINDEAHVLGLVAGKQWPNPLSEGASLFTGSTHKTFPGPQKGIIFTDDMIYAQKAANALYPALLTNHHLMNVASLGYALTEMLEFGEEYAKQTIKNAQAFGEALMEEGFNVIGEHKGFTQSHQILIRTDNYISGLKATKLLEKANIIVNRMELQDANGLRTGMSELTRMGMRESDMKEIAELYHQTLIDKKDPKRIVQAVKDFVSQFKEIKYSFDKGINPYAPTNLG